LVSPQEQLDMNGIKVIGLGGGGVNALNRIIAAHLGGVDYVAADTDAQALEASRAPVKIQLGARLTEGLGSGGYPEIGRRAALADVDKIIDALTGADMVFVITGLGGGTGTGAAPIFASLAREVCALTLAVVTTPFAFEGEARRRQAEQGLKDLCQAADAVVCISSDALRRRGNQETDPVALFRLADEVLRQGVQGISGMITNPGSLRQDFDDIKTAMRGMGHAAMGTASATGDNRAMEAAMRAMDSPLLEDASIKGADRILVSITGSDHPRVQDLYDVYMLVQRAAADTAAISFGTIRDASPADAVTVTLIVPAINSNIRPRTSTGNGQRSRSPRTSNPSCRPSNTNFWTHWLRP
jgi:cell division protein FtsZ